MKRNPYLRVKLKSLADEARTIRREETKAYDTGDYDTGNSLHLHRVGKVRREARATLLAYQYLRGIPYRACETPNPKKHNPIDWKSVGRMVRDYGGGEKFSEEDWIKGEQLKVA